MLSHTMRTLKICRSQTLRKINPIDSFAFNYTYDFFYWIELQVPQGAKNLSEIQEYVR